MNTVIERKKASLRNLLQTKYHRLSNTSDIRHMIKMTDRLLVAEGSSETAQP